MTSRYVVSIIKTGGPAAIAPIEMWVSDQELGLRISLDDYLAGVLEGIGTPLSIMTKSQLKAKVQEHSDRILQLMKEESRKVVV